MISSQSRAGIGAPRPWLRGLSATVTGLQQPDNSKWAEAYEVNRFGSSTATRTFSIFKSVVIGFAK